MLFSSIYSICLTHSWALFYRDAFTPVLFVKVPDHACTSKYLDKSIKASPTCFLQIITLPLHFAWNTIPIRWCCFDARYSVPILSQIIPTSVDTFTKSTGVTVSQYKSAQPWANINSKKYTIAETNDRLQKVYISFARCRLLVLSYVCQYPCRMDVYWKNRCKNITYLFWSYGLIFLWS